MKRQKEVAVATTTVKEEARRPLTDLNPKDFPEGNGSEKLDLDVDLGDINLSIGNDKENKKVEENAKGIRKWVETHLAKLDELRDTPKAVRIREENRKAGKKIREKIDSFLYHKEEPAYRQAAWIAYLVYGFGHCLAEAYDEAMDFLDKMVRDGYLEEGNDHAPLQAWRRHFRVPEIASFTRTEFDEAKRALCDLVNKVTTTTARRRNDRVAELQEEADLKEPSRAFEKGQEGRAFVYVPPQINLTNGKFFIRKEGFLLIEVTADGRIFPLEGVGSFEEEISEASACGVFLKSFTLEWDWPPGKKKLAEAGLSDKQVNGVHFCWYLLKRAKNALLQVGQHQEERLTLSKEVSVSSDVFLLEGQEGVTLIDFDGTWETWTQGEDGKSKREQVGHLFILVERRNINKVQIVGCPDHLKDFFSGCMLEYEEGEKFLGVPQPLQSVLQAQYGAEQTKSLLR